MGNQNKNLSQTPFAQLASLRDASLAKTSGLNQTQLSESVHLALKGRKVLALGEQAAAKGSGFTLIELLVVIAIIGLLASVVLVALNGARAKSRDTKRVADMDQMAKAMELYFNDHFSYPTTTGVAAGTYGVLSTANPCGNGVAGCISYLSPNYIVTMPKAPTPSDGSCGGNYGGATANDYQFAGTGAGVNTINNYTMTFCIGLQTGVYAPGVHTLTNGGFQ